MPEQKHSCSKANSQRVNDNSIPLRFGYLFDFSKDRLRACSAKNVTAIGSMFGADKFFSQARALEGGKRAIHFLASDPSIHVAAAREFRTAGFRVDRAPTVEQNPSGSGFRADGRACAYN